jgi:hypothetical protein
VIKYSIDSDAEKGKRVGGTRRQLTDSRRCWPQLREQMRRWGRMPLAEMILALEEMQILAEKLAQSSGPRRERS